MNHAAGARLAAAGPSAKRNWQGGFDEVWLAEDDCDVILRRPVPGPRAETFQNSKLTIGSTVSSRPEAFRITILRRFPNDEQ